LKKSIPRQAQRVLELQDQDEKPVVPPTTVKFDVIRPAKSKAPLDLLPDHFINYPLDRDLTVGLVPVKPDRASEVLGSTPNF
jgi:hypothetical protein